MTMDIIILGAIPHDALAKESEAYLEKQAPNFVRLLQTHQASIEYLDLETIGCTPYEYYLLKQANYPHQYGFYAKGLAPLRCVSDFNTNQTDTKSYLIELCHVEIGLNHASLYTADELAIQTHESEALFAHLQEVLDLGHYPYRLVSVHGHTAIIDMGSDFEAELFSPQLLATGYLNDWQRHANLPRELRQFYSELQMSWFNHPINQQREAQGLKPINSAWIYGGDYSWENLSSLQQKTASSMMLIDDLALSHRHQDWGIWLSQLAQLENRLKTLPQTSYRVLLFGFDRIITLTQKTFFSKLFNNKHQWKHWWSTPL